jgi:hypothetical protein
LRMYDFKHATGRFGESPRPPRSVPIPSMGTRADSRQAG